MLFYKKKFSLFFTKKASCSVCKRALRIPRLIYRNNLFSHSSYLLNEKIKRFNIYLERDKNGKGIKMEKEADKLTD